jgi:hypothetical protein
VAAETFTSVSVRNWYVQHILSSLPDFGFVLVFVCLYCVCVLCCVRMHVFPAAAGGQSSSQLEGIRRMAAKCIQENDAMLARVEM